jgi:membrane-bound lytic murein transglycosylase D
MLVPAESPSAATALSLSQAVFTTVPQGRTTYYRVQRGDTLSSIARSHHVSVAEIRAWNGLSQNRISVGQRLRINSEGVATAAAHGTHPRATHAKPVVRQTSAPAAQAKSKRDKPVQATANGGSG